MHVWTTVELNELYLDKRVPVMLYEHEELKKVFAANSEPDDIALVKMDAEYRLFYSAFKKRNFTGRILFISSGMDQPLDTHLANAVILNADKVGVSDIKKIIRFILDLALSLLNEPNSNIYPECGSREKINCHPIEDQTVIRDLLVQLAKKNIPVTLAYEIMEYGEPVIAKCACTIKELRENLLVVHNLRYAHFLNSLKKDANIRALLPYKHENREGLASISDIKGSEAILTIPAKLYPQERHTNSTEKE